MSCGFSETEDIDYDEENKMTRWTIVELWKCYQCPGPEGDEE